MKNSNKLIPAILIAGISIIAIIITIGVALSNQVGPQVVSTNIISSPLPIIQLSPSETFDQSSSDPAFALPPSTLTAPPNTSPDIYASSFNQCQPPIGWILIISQQGDTLQKIAAKYNVSPDLLRTANCLTSASLTPGAPLYVPKPGISSVAAIPTQAAYTGSTCGPPSSWILYTIKPGDNLFRISLAYRVSISQLQWANCLGSSTLIRSGDKLYVPNVPTTVPSPTITKTPTPITPAPNSPPVSTNDDYIVTAGVAFLQAAPGVLSNDSDSDGDPLTAILISAPSCDPAFTLSLDGSFTYTADTLVICPGATADSFTYKSNDGTSDSNVVTVNITINP